LDHLSVYNQIRTLSSSEINCQ